MEPLRPVIVVTGKRRPHEVLLFAYSIGAGIALPLRDSLPPSMQGWNIPWAVALVLSGVIGLVGCYWRRSLWTGLSLERAGLLFNAACTFCYAVSVFTSYGRSGAFSAGFVTAWAVANVVRSLQIGNDLRSLGRGIRDADRPVT